MPRTPSRKGRRKRAGPPPTAAQVHAEILAGADDPTLDPLVREWLRELRDHGTTAPVPMPPSPGARP